MPDDINISDGLGGTAVVSSDLLDDGSHAQEVKILQSAATDGSRWTIGASGALVDLGTNNDITLTSGTLTAIAGTVTTSIAGTPTVAISGGTTTFSGSLGAGTERIGYVGISSDGTAIADMLSLTSGTAVAVGIYDNSGNQVNLSAPDEVTASPTIGTAASAQYDSLHTTIMTFANAASANGGTGRILGARLVCKHDTFAGTIVLHLFRKSVTGTTAQDALAVSDPDKLESIGSPLTFDFSTVPPMGGGRVVSADRSVLPLDYKCDAATSSLFGILQLTSADTPTFAAADLVPFLSYLAD